MASPASPGVMSFKLDDLTVYWPYPTIYPEQYDYCLELKKALDAKGHGLIEMPTGTGKTVSILATVTAYRFQYPDTGKLIYCTRTVPEMQKCLKELKGVIAARVTLTGCVDATLALCLSSRRNMCVNEEVMANADRDSVDRLCRSRTVRWAEDDDDDDRRTSCSFYENLENYTAAEIPSGGVYTLKDVKDFGISKGWCPYFLTRRILEFADVIVFNYAYMLDPKVASLVSKELSKESVVVFDEAHNIDNVCIESLSVNFDRRRLQAAARNVHALKSRVDHAKAIDKIALEREYAKLVSGLNAIDSQTQTFDMRDSIVTTDLANAVIPGAIRKAENFVALLDSATNFLKSKMDVQDVRTCSTTAFAHDLKIELSVELKSLRFAYTRLMSLLRTLRIVNIDDFSPISQVADLLTLIATPSYEDGFAVVIEPCDPRTPHFRDPTLKLACLDASVAMKPVLTRFQTVIITSGTLSPIDLYPKLLGFEPVVKVSLGMSTTAEPVKVLVVSRGSDQNVMSSSFASREDASVLRNYGFLLIELSTIIPDGLVVFFPSYDYLEKAIADWSTNGVLERILSKKLIFIETKDVVETTLALENYRRACDVGRGALFFSIARGKVSEGVDFEHHYGRCVVLVGVPYQYTKSRVLEQRLSYMRRKHNVKESDFLSFDALRQTAQCVGRVVRSKSDWGIAILADVRYGKPSKRNKLPPWINQFLSASHLDLSVEEACVLSRGYLRGVGQTSREAIQLLGPKELEELAHRRGDAARAAEDDAARKRARTQW